MDNLSKRAVLVSLEISHWSARCVDKKVSDEVLLNNSAESDSGSFSKRLIAKDYLSEITKVNNEARKYFKKNTMAWETGKRRLLPSKKITEFTEKMRELKEQHEDVCKVFVDNYETYMTEAQTFLNGLFNPADYPSKDEVEKKFGFEYEFTNIDSPDDFRCAVSEDVKEEIQQKMQDKVTEKLTMSINRLYQKIHSLLKKFEEKLSDEDAVFRNSLIDNIEDLVAMLPDMNIMEDAKLKELTDKIANEICRFDADQLRKDKAARREAVEASRSIMDTMGELYA